MFCSHEKLNLSIDNKTSVILFPHPYFEVTGILHQPKLTLFISFAILVLQHSNDAAAQRALFVFGDSLVDVGNNNFLNSIAKSNYFPYGIDFNMQPTGRFSNGKTFVDIIGEMLSLPYPSAFADPNTRGVKLLGGVNYASAAAGILDESGQHYGQRYILSQEVLNFETTLDQLRTMMGRDNLKNFLGKSVAVLVFGSNDYINNYLLPSINSSSFTY
ncbi:GDSL esterase/lipase At1g71250-like [Hibiscus syriacus]|uniref:GDSL esterase/lipase At1g71250-like n=1 Tax=Hibiscus syriacus TaxID=106335 RepID=UPI001923DD96|nr:GDSL esterase/lipase At1g71250-like [Hibiscus syriacus]